MVADARPSVAVWRWDNVPVPEPHVAALAAAALVHAIAPARLPLGRRIAHLVGWPLVAGGTALAAWAVTSASASGVSVDRPSQLVKHGAYAVSRNPMYVAWSISLVGLAIVARSAWMLIGAVLASGAVHREVLREEVVLDRAFADEYRAYREATPRYG
jgi:protein-S-isoprenylcysteine O-methyltransferase Ste14